MIKTVFSEILKWLLSYFNRNPPIKENYHKWAIDDTKELIELSDRGCSKSHLIKWFRLKYNHSGPSNSTILRKLKKLGYYINRKGIVCKKS